MKHILAYFVLIFLSTGLLAQEKSWNEALDQYERICQECISLRARSMAGESIATSSVTELLGQLAALRKVLLQADGTMTPEQRKRFSEIRTRYESVFGLRRTNSKLALSPVAVSLPPALVTTVLHQEVIIPVQRRLQDISPSPRGAKIRFNGLLYLNTPDCAPGVFLGAGSAVWGGFVKGTFSPKRTNTSYTCLSDGTLSGGGYIWTSGQEKTQRYSISAGATYALRPSICLYLGAGYGSRTILWQDASSAWAKVENLSTSGPIVETGVLYHYGHLSLMLGISSIGFKNYSADVGIGFSFR